MLLQCYKDAHTYLLGQTFDYTRFSVMVLTIVLIVNFKPLFRKAQMLNIILLCDVRNITIEL